MYRLCDTIFEYNFFCEILYIILCVCLFCYLQSPEEQDQFRDDERGGDGSGFSGGQTARKRSVRLPQSGVAPGTPTSSFRRKPSVVSYYCFFDKLFSIKIYNKCFAFVSFRTRKRIRLKRNRALRVGRLTRHYHGGKIMFIFSPMMGWVFFFKLICFKTRSSLKKSIRKSAPSPPASQGVIREASEERDDKKPVSASEAAKKKYSSEESSDEDDIREMEGNIYTKAGYEVKELELKKIIIIKGNLCK